MSSKSFIPLEQLCTYYELEMSFFNNLDEFGIIEITTIEQSKCIHQDNVRDLEKVIRMHNELDINFQGIDTIFNLLDKINNLESELISVKNRLRLYEDE